MLRASWTGSITFGLVAIPIKAIPVQSPKDIRFELLHQPCSGKMQSKRYCPRCERDVEEGEVVRGFQHAKGQYVMVAPEETEALVTPAKRTIQIVDFVSLAEIDPIYYEKPYYLQPTEGGERTYALLHRSMADRGKVGIGKVALRDRESLAAIRPLKHALVMEIIAWPDEVRAIEDAIPPIDAKIDERELQMGHLLINTLSGPFDPEKYQDEYRNALTRLIEAKVEGGAVSVAAAAAPKQEVSDLMEMLRRSLEATQAVRDEVPVGSNGHLNGKAEEKELVEAGR